jgi:hypothetical protein
MSEVPMPTDGFLHRYFLSNAYKPLHKWFHYFDIYERHFERFRGTSVTMLEIGVAGGGSLPMWRDYLGPSSKVIGLDINPACKVHEGPGIEVFTGSQDDTQVLSALVDAHPSIDVVLDDGSHQMGHMLASFQFLYPRISPTGVYVVEDTHTCYWDEYGGGLGREGTFIEFAKSMIDVLHAMFSRGAVPKADFTTSTLGIAFYDSMVVFERRPQGRRQAVITGPFQD